MLALTRAEFKKLFSEYMWYTVFPLTIFHYRGEHLLLFLVQTVARQTVEHCQYRPPRIREDRNRKTANPEGKNCFSEINGRFHISVPLPYAFLVFCLFYLSRF